MFCLQIHTRAYRTINEEFSILRRTSFPGCLFPIRREILIGVGHVYLLNKHFPTGVESSLYFNPATGRKRNRLTRHFFNNLNFSMEVSKRSKQLLLDSHKSGQARNKSFCDR